jgi:hypothetical protein
MDSATPIFIPSVDQNHVTRETIEALQNLLFLIQMDAGHPHRIRAHVKHAESVLSRATGHLPPIHL